MRLVQLINGTERQVALVDEPDLRLVDGCASIYQLAAACIAEGEPLGAMIESRIGARTVDYSEVYAGRSPWRLLPSADHPSDLARCMISGTGLTHTASAHHRHTMHSRTEDLSDSLRMYRWGAEGGKPAEGAPGVSPEWFYKGRGDSLRAHNEQLVIPAHATDGGEEAEIAAVYLIDPRSDPWRIGLSVGNEFSDHEFERKNYLYLASSKLRMCSLGPELVMGGQFEQVPGRAAITRNGGELWSKEIRTGERNMVHSLANIEHHHFKFDLHRQPGDLHIHFLGAGAFSFGDGIRLETGDVMQIEFDGFGRPLRNPVTRREHDERAVSVKVLEV